MAEFKLTYFNLRGRAEFARLIFAKAGVSYDDHRIKKEEWLELKPNTPWGTLPNLKYGEMEIGQSVPIARFLANKFGLAGKDECERARADSIVDVCGDFVNKYSATLHASNEEEKSKAQKAMEEFGGRLWGKMEKALEANGGNFLVGDAMTWADIVLVGLFGNDLENEKMNKHFPKLMAHTKKVAADPAIKKWLDERPVTDM